MILSGGLCVNKIKMLIIFETLNTFGKILFVLSLTNVMSMELHSNYEKIRINFIKNCRVLNVNTDKLITH